jgi:hypothetical protein
MKRGIETGSATVMVLKNEGDDMISGFWRLKETLAYFLRCSIKICKETSSVKIMLPPDCWPYIPPPLA